MSTRPKFDEDQAATKVCRYGKQPEFIQNGNRFDASRTYIGKADDPTDTPEKRADQKKDVRARAAEKIGNLDGFKPPEKPSAIQNALNENEAARKAEEHS